MYLRARWKRVFSLGIGIIVVLIWFKTYALDDQDPSTVTNIVLIGATGDLAKRYLWQGLFNLFIDFNKGSHVMGFYGAARLGYAEGNEQLSEILEGFVKCPENLPECGDLKKTFFEQVKYVQLKTPDHYLEVCNTLNNDLSTKKLSEVGRLFYLSVPPFAYPEIVENINKACRPMNTDTWLRVVLEKPFGSDLKSARHLALKLSQHLHEKEIYRIDHYLGKPGVRSILPFRVANSDILDAIWNHKHIEYVEIALKETLDVKGRISFYDKYGVIRDVMQNHLTEILGLVAMEIPKSVNDVSIQENKLQLFKNVLPVTTSQTVIGQYQSYVNEWMEETSQNPGNLSFTPTFAASILFVNNERWKGVPFVLMSGKKLMEKLSYVKIVFKNLAVCPTSVSWKKDDECETKQIVFILSQSGSKYPHILISKNFPKPKMPDRIHEHDIEISQEFQVFSKSILDYFLFSTMEGDAYTSLLKDCYYGDRINFVDTDRLMASWEIWSNVLDELKGSQPRIYSLAQSQSGWLNFEVKGQSLQYSFQENVIDDSFVSSLASSYDEEPKSFRNQPLYDGSAEEVIDELARAIYDNAQRAIKIRGTFHLAFSGGNSPKMLFSKLSTDYSEELPWQKTHIWMVDERCVPRTDVRSNFNSLQEYLLKNIAIPHFNVHPMPTELINGLCSSEDKGPQVYAAEMSRHIEGDRLDFVVLGVGSDGHTASLYPKSVALNETYHRVIVTSDGPEDTVRYRMSMTYYTINNAANVAVMMLGSEKREIVKILSNENEKQFTKYPILGVKLVNGTLEWYVDDLAMGNQ